MFSYPCVPAIDLSEMSVEVICVNHEALDVVAAVPDEDMAVKIVQGRIRTHGHDLHWALENQEIDIIQEETRLVVDKVKLLIYRVGGAGLQNFSVSSGGNLTIMN